MGNPSDRSVDAAILDSPERLSAIRGGMLDSALDTGLQEIAAEAAETLDYPIALVSLVMRRVQYFRAHVGLPRELEVSRSTDRCLSFCQFAVSSGETFRVPDAPANPELPQDLVERYGIRAYLGTPLRVDGQPVGTLCVIDVKARTIEDEEAHKLERLARRVEERLLELADMGPTPKGLLRSAARPAFLEMRNLLNALGGDLEYLGMALHEAQGAMALFEEMAREKLAPEEATRAGGALKEAVDCWRELIDVQSNLHTAYLSLSRHVIDLEASLLDDKPTASIEDVTRVSELLAGHATRNVGGAHWSLAPGTAPIDNSLGRVAVVLSAGLVTLAQALPTGSRQGVSGRASSDDRTVRFVLTAGDATEAAYQKVAEELEHLCIGQSRPSIAADPDGVTLVWPAAQST